MSCACLLSARGEVALREARDLILLGVFGMSAASPALSATSSAGASCGSIPGAANPALVATSVMPPRLSSCRQAFNAVVGVGELKLIGRSWAFAHRVQSHC